MLIIFYTHCEIVIWSHSQNRTKLKVVKWGFKKWNDHILQNNALQCEILQKKSMKKLKRPNSLFLQGKVSSVVLKAWKTRKTKTWITQNFQIPYPIHHVKAHVLRISKRWYFFGVGVFKGELLAVRVGSIFNFFDRKMWCWKKIDTATILIFGVWGWISVRSTLHADSTPDPTNQNCGRVFFFCNSSYFL